MEWARVALEFHLQWQAEEGLKEGKGGKGPLSTEEKLLNRFWDLDKHTLAFTPREWSAYPSGPGRRGNQRAKVQPPLLW